MQALLHMFGVGLLSYPWTDARCCHHSLQFCADFVWLCVFVASLLAGRQSTPNTVFRQVCWAHQRGLHDERVN